MSLELFTWIVITAQEQQQQQQQQFATSNVLFAYFKTFLKSSRLHVNGFSFWLGWLVGWCQWLTFLIGILNKPYSHEHRQVFAAFGAQKK